MRTPMITIGIAAAMLAIFFGAGTAAAAPPGTGAAAVDTSALRVHYGSAVISNDAAVALQAEAEQAGREFVLVYDATSAAEGTAHAFDSAAAADRYAATLPSEQFQAAVPLSCRGTGRAAIRMPRRPQHLQDVRQHQLRRQQH